VAASRPEAETQELPRRRAVDVRTNGAYDRGVDCNSPLLDHPELADVVYHTKRIGGRLFDQEEYLLHDPDPKRHAVRPLYRHSMRDIYRARLMVDDRARSRAGATFRRTARDELGRAGLSCCDAREGSGRITTVAAAFRLHLRHT
jgi:hypothetical protein